MSYLAKETRRQYILPSSGSRTKASKQVDHDNENIFLRNDGIEDVTTTPRDKGKGKGCQQMKSLSELKNQSLMNASSSRSDLESIEEWDDGRAIEIEKDLDKLCDHNGE